MKRQFILAMCFFAALFTVKGQSEKIKFVEYDLPNGLHVVLHHDDQTPNVLVSLMYHVGSKNENPSRTGFAHFFEHLMFEGTENINRGEYFGIVQARGGSLNANTSQDRTYYYEYMPSNELELALWMEAERMYHAKIDTTGINTQKGVVIEERKQTYENRPYGVFLEELSKRAFTQHPYQWMPIGYPEHIRASTYEEIYDFYQTYYVPNNCVLVVAGDFNEKQTREWIDKYFASIPRGTKEMYRPNIVEPIRTQEVVDTVYDNIQIPGIFFAYPAPANGTQEYYAMDVLIQILSGGASSRLKTNLTDKGLTLETGLMSMGQEDPGVNIGIVLANMGQSLEDVKEAFTNEIEKVTQELVSEEEFQMAMAAKEFQVAAGMTSLEGIAQELANCYTYYKNTDEINHILSHYDSITRQDLLNVAKKYLQTPSRVTLYYLPISEKPADN
jgi:Predicted Zn-dependent peptidases